MAIFNSYVSLPEGTAAPVALPFSRHWRAATALCQDRQEQESPQWSQAVDCCVARVLIVQWYCSDCTEYLRYILIHSETQRHSVQSRSLVTFSNQTHGFSLQDMQKFVIQVVTGGPVAGACQPRGCKYCNDDATLSGHWPQLFGLSPLAVNPWKIQVRTGKFPKNFKILRACSHQIHLDKNSPGRIY